MCSWGCQDQHSWCVLCQRKCVSWRVQGQFFGGFVCNLYWLLSGLPGDFSGLDVALGLRVNQYKLFVYLFLPLNSFKLSCYYFCWYKQPIVFLVFCCFVLYILANRISDWISYKGFCSSWKSFRKPPLNNSPPPPLSFKAIYSNNWHQELGTWKILKFDPKIFFQWLKNYLLERVLQLTDHLCSVVWIINSGKLEWKSLLNL